MHLVFPRSGPNSVNKHFVGEVPQLRRYTAPIWMGHDQMLAFILRRTDRLGDVPDTRIAAPWYCVAAARK